MKALILAAGYGTRLRPHTERRPKPLFAMAGGTLLDRTLGALERAGCTEAAVNTHHLAEQIRRHVHGRRYSIRVEIRHEPEILGTGGAIANFRDFWDDEPFLVVNSDIVTDIDLGAVYAAHLDQPAPVTLVLVDDPRFNTVAVDNRHQVVGFGPTDGEGNRGPVRRLTFTGIQVIDPGVLGYFPPGIFSSSIDAYRAMLATGLAIRGLVVENRYWKDVGTEERFREAALEMAGRKGFEAAHGRAPGAQARWQRLAGDGSQRRWHRLTSEDRALIVSDHGITDTEETAEIDAFVAIGRHLDRQGLPVPRIYFHHRFSGMVCLEDLGNVHLQDRAREAGTEAALLALYRPVIDDLIHLSVRGAQGFDPAWTHQSEAYDKDTIIEAECRYFVEAFCNGYLDLGVDFADYAQEFETLARQTLAFSVKGFMHRDFQSRNLMVHRNRCRIIDFQGGRRGPIQYDLASLLIDPYTRLSKAVQAALVDHCIAGLKAVPDRVPLNEAGFRKGYACCRITRNLQILGAFGFLTRVRGKAFFESYIPTAAATLGRHLAAEGIGPFDRLIVLSEEILKHIGDLKSPA